MKIAKTNTKREFKECLPLKVKNEILDEADKYYQSKGLELGKIIGNGMIGIVYVARWMMFPFNICVIKECNYKKIMEKKISDSILREIKIYQVIYEH